MSSKPIDVCWCDCHTVVDEGGVRGSVQAWPKYGDAVALLASCAGCRADHERWILAHPHRQPEVGETRLCLLCAYERPWGIYDAATGASVCIECRDRARA